MRKQVTKPKPITLGVVESIYATSNGRVPTRRGFQVLWALVDTLGVIAAAGVVILVVLQVLK